MKINITADFSIADLEKDMKERMQVWFDEIATSLFETGKETVDRSIEKARAVVPHDGGGFGNITYNLRSSIGCGLFRNGSIQQDYFPFGKGAEGQVKGREVMNSVAFELDPNVIALVLVAGEEYGVFVQMKGYDVTDMSWARFEVEFERKIRL